MKGRKDSFFLVALYLLGIVLLCWTLLVFFYQYFAVIGKSHAVFDGLRSGRILSALWLSISTACVTAIVSILFGVPLAYVFATGNFRGKGILETLTIDIPQTFPPVAVGIIFLNMLGPSSPFHINLAYTYEALVLSQIFVSAPFVIAFATRQFREIRESGLDMIARTLGASNFKIFWTIFLPLALKDIIAGASLCWARAMGELGGSLLFAGVVPFKTEVIPTFIAQNSFNTAAALAATILATTASIIALLSFKAIMSGRGAWKGLFYKI
ncbi:TPA: hypothetical protein DDZ86_04180 [Candidatus Dependentiae bacterium]|nr:MAG: Molybdate ABC transporter, inner membrane subunit [candidate division TM6 bacterium GW2011_GWF2_43_87]HBL98812.1 hypothetical protein [Candidatus Dependentiae bacterium]